MLLQDSTSHGHGRDLALVRTANLAIAVYAAALLIRVCAGVVLLALAAASEACLRIDCLGGPSSTALNMTRWCMPLEERVSFAAGCCQPSAR